MAIVRSTGEVFGSRLRELRQKRGLTQVQLAERCGFPQARISELERGGRSPNLTTIVRLAVALGCKLSALVTVFDAEDLESLLPAADE
jgi:transcriptional regulator with XRE-family HTH domain